MRIIQAYLDDEEETRCTRKKAVNSARTVFVKVKLLLHLFLLTVILFIFVDIDLVFRLD